MVPLFPPQTPAYQYGDQPRKQKLEGILLTTHQHYHKYIGILTSHNIIYICEHHSRTILVYKNAIIRKRSF